MLKRLVKLVVVVVVLLIVAVGVAIYSIDAIARSAVEKAGTHVFGARTSLGGMRIGLLNPSASLETLAVANPPAFAGSAGSTSFLELGTGAMAVDARSLMSDVVRIPSIKLSDLTLRLDQQGAESNASVILGNMKRALGGSGSSTPGASGPGRRYVIDELLIERIDIHAKASGLPIAAPTTNLKVERVRLESLGSGGKDPIGMDQLMAIVVNAVMQAAIEAGAGQLPKELLQGMLSGVAGLGTGVPNFALSIDMGGGLKPTGDLAALASRAGLDASSISSKVAEEVSKGLGDVGKKLEDAGKSAGDAIKQGLGGIR